MFRQYQILWNEKDFWRSARGVNDLMVCVIADKPQLNTVLTHYEEPSHLLFNGRNFSGDDEYEKKWNYRTDYPKTPPMAEMFDESDKKWDYDEEYEK